MEIIALSGFARAGKDETAKVLVEEFGFTQVAFADKLRDFLYAMNPPVAPSKEGPGMILVQEVIDVYGWQGYKETEFGAEIRRQLQRLGTEAGRQTLWDTIWIDAAFTGLSSDAKVVVSDARFYNEFDAVRSRGGEVWRIERPGVGPANDHASEMEAIDYPHFAKTLHNSRDLEFFRGLVKQAYGDFSTERNVITAKPVVVDDQLNSAPVVHSPLAPRKGDGSITSVNVPKKRGRM